MILLIQAKSIQYKDKDKQLIKIQNLFFNNTFIWHNISMDPKKTMDTIINEKFSSRH